MSETKEKAGKLKVKRPKKLVKSDEPKKEIPRFIKIRFKKTEKLKEQEDAVQKSKTEQYLMINQSGDIQKVEIKEEQSDQPEEMVEPETKEELPIIEEIIEEPVKEEEIIEIGEKRTI